MITAPDFSKKQVVFVFFNEGEKMSISNDNLVVKNNDGSIKLQCTCYRLFIVFAVGNFSFTSAVVQKAKKFGFYIACLSSGFHLNNIIGSEKEGNTLLKKRQYEYDSLDIAAHIIRNKISNQISVLSFQRYKNDCVLECISTLKEYVSIIDDKDDVNRMMAYEGLASKMYFKNHFNNIKWNGRQPRLKLDYVNSTMDIGYSLLFTFIDCIASCYGFDTYVGVLHRCYYMRKSLICDLVEPFRPLIDHEIKKGINLKQIKQEDFVEVNKQQKLKYENSQKYVKFFMKPILDNKDEIFKYIQQYYYSFMKGVSGEQFPVFSIEK